MGQAKSDAELVVELIEQTEDLLDSVVEAYEYLRLVSRHLEAKDRDLIDRAMAELEEYQK